MDLLKTIKTYLQVGAFADGETLSKSKIYKHSAYNLPFTKEQKKALKKRWNKIKAEVDSAFNKE